MAWKLRKDKLQEDAPTGASGLADAVGPQEADGEMPAFPENPRPLRYDTIEAELRPLVFGVPEPAHAAEALEPSPQSEADETPFAPSFIPDAAFEVNHTGDTPGAVEEPRLVTPEPVFTFGSPFALGTPQDTTENVAGHGGVEEPPGATPEPVFPPEPGIPEEPLSSGPFMPYQPDETTPPATHAAEHPFVLLDREEIAPSLVHTDPDSDVPRVAPFIVDVPPAAEHPPLPEALIVRIGNFSAHFVLTKDVTVIGRPDSLLQSYPDVEIDLDDAVSRRHAEIRRQEGGYAIVDLRSTNGTLLNGERLVPHREYLLEHGDRVNLGDRTEIVFE